MERSNCPFCRYDITKTGHQKQCQYAIKVDPQEAKDRAERKKSLEAEKLKKFKR